MTACTNSNVAVSEKSLLPLVREIEKSNCLSDYYLEESRRYDPATTLGKLSESHSRRARACAAAYQEEFNTARAKQSGASQENDSLMSRRMYDGEDLPAKYANVNPPEDDLEAYRSYQRKEVSNGDGDSSNDSIVTVRATTST